MIAWLAALRDRPIAERERRQALLAVATLLIATTTLLALTGPRQDPPPRTGASILRSRCCVTAGVPRCRDGASDPR